MSQDFDSQRILRLGVGFWGAKTLLTAVSLGLFDALADGPLDAPALTTRLELHPRGARDFLDALVALGMLERADDQYANTPEADHYLVRSRPCYIGGWLELCDTRLYPVWGALGEALRTGLPQNEAKEVDDYYANLCDAPTRLRTFLSGMAGLSMEASRAIVRRFPWSRYRTFVDVGGAQGLLAVQLAQAHPHLHGGCFDLPPVGPFFDSYVASFGLDQRLRFYPGNFFQQPLPSADVLVMGHVLHNWSLPEKRTLLAKAYDALAPGGVLLIYEALLDDQRRQNAFGLLMSLNMLLVTQGGFVFTGAECETWLREAGFRETSVAHLDEANSMISAVK